MNRREFLSSAGIVTAALACSDAKQLFAFDTEAHGWRSFEITTRVEVLNPSGVTRVWVPAALLGPTPFQRTVSNRFSAVGGRAEFVASKEDSLGIVAAQFPSGVPPVLIVTSQVATRDYNVNFSSRRHLRRVDSAQLEYFRRSTALLPTDGIVRSKALEITHGAGSDIEKARAIYEWIVDNTFRNPKTRGCGTGDIRWMLESGDLGGKCADLNALYVGLARAAGLPARDVYGIRVAKSALGYKSLGTASDKITKAQHCRAEVYLSEYGWVPVDPADVRKVVLEEPPGNRAIDNEMVKAARARLFGSWEMNWIAYNFAHDVKLPNSSGVPVGFLMYPQAETDSGRLDSLNPDNFRYEITAHEISSAQG